MSVQRFRLHKILSDSALRHQQIAYLCTILFEKCWCFFWCSHSRPGFCVPSCFFLSIPGAASHTVENKLPRSWQTGWKRRSWDCSSEPLGFLWAWGEQIRKADFRRVSKQTLHKIIMMLYSAVLSHLELPDFRTCGSWCLKMKSANFRKFAGAFWQTAELLKHLMSEQTFWAKLISRLMVSQTFRE